MLLPCVAPVDFSEMTAFDRCILTQEQMKHMDVLNRDFFASNAAAAMFKPWDDLA